MNKSLRTLCLCDEKFSLGLSTAELKYILDHIYELTYIRAMIDAKTVFSALSNEIRLRCLLLMQQEGELCVCELTTALDLSQPMISRHLALLKENLLVLDRREGQWVYYQINPKLPDWVLTVLSTTATANLAAKPFSDDLQRLENMLDRPDRSCCE